MFSSISKRLLRLKDNSSTSTSTSRLSTSHVRVLLRNAFTRAISNASEAATNPSSLTVSYLTYSCGLSPQAALSLSSKVLLKTIDNPDAVLKFLVNHGFNKTQITYIVSKNPRILLANVEKTLKPKLDVFDGIGFTGTSLSKFITKDPCVFAISLNKITCCIDFLKHILGTNENVIRVLNRTAWLFRHSLQQKVFPNVQLLRNQGIPESKISKLVLMRCSVLLRSPVQIAALIEKIKRMGVDPSREIFIYLVCAMTLMTRSTWDRKLAVYKGFGCSESEVLLAFGKQPACMLVPAEKIMRRMDFFMVKLSLRPADVLAYPTLFIPNLEKTIIPRCSVLKILMVKGLIKRNAKIVSKLHYSNANFLRKFVIKYQERAPEVLKAYEGKIEFLGFDRCEDADRGGNDVSHTDEVSEKNKVKQCCPPWISNAFQSPS